MSNNYTKYMDFWNIMQFTLYKMYNMNGKLCIVLLF